MRALAETTGHVGDAGFAEALTPYVGPYRGQLFVAFGLFCDGAADRALGQVALARGLDTAIAHLEAALALEERFRAPSLATRTRYWLARTLRERGDSADPQRAEHELTVAACTAHDLGLVGVQHLIERLHPTAS